MTKIELLVRDFIVKNLKVLSVILFFILGTIIRFNFRWFVSLDMSSYFLPWYHGYRNAGGLAALSQQISNVDYTVLHQLFYALISYFDIEPLFLIKGFSIGFDLLQACLVALIVFELSKSSWKAIAGFCISWLSPIVFLNSSCFGQNDSIYVSFLLAAIFFYIKKKNVLFMIMYAFALSIKLQAILFLPVILFFYFLHKRFSILHFLWIPCVYLLTSLPAIIAGRPFMEVINIYFLQTQEFDSVYSNYPSLWSLFLNQEGASKYNEFWHGAAMFFAFSVALGWIIWLFINSQKKDCAFFVISTSFILLYSIVFFICGMHERYAYFVEILAIIMVLMKKETLIPMVLLYVSTLCSYSTFLFNSGYTMVVPAILNSISYIMYTIFIIKENKENDTQEIA